MAGRYGDWDYPELTKRSFLFGVCLFLVGVLGEFAIGFAGVSVPGWEHALLINAVEIGILIAFFSPIVFGIVLPLTE